MRLAFITFFTALLAAAACKHVPTKPAPAKMDGGSRDGGSPDGGHWKHHVREVP